MSLAVVGEIKVQDYEAAQSVAERFSAFADSIGTTGFLLSASAVAGSEASVLLLTSAEQILDSQDPQFLEQVKAVTARYFAAGRTTARYREAVETLERLAAAYEVLGPDAVDRALAVLEADATARVIHGEPAPATVPSIVVNVNPELRAVLERPEPQEIEFERNARGEIVGAKTGATA